jgi:ADP-ribose pyrophosphatase YjhB (NUDIX family)
MAQKYKVFNGKRSMHIIERFALGDEINESKQAQDLEQALIAFLKPGRSVSPAKKTVLFSVSPDETFELLKSHFNVRKAAGGLVFNENGELLVMRRLGHLDLPKGHQELGEELHQTAWRETREECGIDSHFVLDLNPIATHHIYELRNNWIWKTTHWFLMQVPNCPMLTPQTEESIEEVFWMKQKEFEIKKPGFYASLHELISDAYHSYNRL